MPALGRAVWLPALLMTTAIALPSSTSHGPAAPALTSPLVAEWAGPFGGVPPFDHVRVEHFAPAFDQAMAAYRGEIRRIAENPAPADFTNTLAALEDSGRMLDRVGAVYGVWGSTMSTPELRAFEQESEPKLAALRDEVFQNEALFRRVAAVYEAREGAGLTPEQRRLAWVHHQAFVRAGARLEPAAKARVAAINPRLAPLFTTFSQALPAAGEGRFTGGGARGVPGARARGGGGARASR